MGGAGPAHPRHRAGAAGCGGLAGGSRGAGLLQPHRVRGGHAGLLSSRAEDDPDQDQLDRGRDRLRARRRRLSPGGNRRPRGPRRGPRAPRGVDRRPFRRLGGSPRPDAVSRGGHRLPHSLHLWHHWSPQGRGTHSRLRVHFRAVVGVLLAGRSGVGTSPRRQAPHGGPALPRRSPGLRPGRAGQRRTHADHGTVGCRPSRGRHQRRGDRHHHGADHVPPAPGPARRAQSRIGTLPFGHRPARGRALPGAPETAHDRVVGPDFH